VFFLTSLATAKFFSETIILWVVESLQGCGSWKVFGGDNYDVLCSAKDCCRFVTWKTALKVFMASSMSKKEPDYRVMFKNMYGKDHIIFHGTESLAEVLCIYIYVKNLCTTWSSSGTC
jgi:hypothetical protein